MNLKLLFLSFFCLMSFKCLSQTTEVKNEYESGQLTNGYKTGIWEYLDNEGELALKVDYDSGKLLYLKPDTSRYLIQVDGEWVLKNVTRPAHYMGSYKEFYKVLSANLRYPYKATKRKAERTVYLEFEVSPQGKATNIQVLNDPDNYFSEAVIKSFNQIPNFWVNSIYDGKSVPAKLTLPIQFVISDKKNSEKEDSLTLSDLKGKKLDKIIVSSSTIQIR